MDILLAGLVDLGNIYEIVMMSKLSFPYCEGNHSKRQHIAQIDKSRVGHKRASGKSVTNLSARTPCLYPRHLCRGVYSFRLSVRMFVCLFVRSFVRTSFRRVEFASKFCVKVSQVVYISATTHQKAFIFGP